MELTRFDLQNQAIQRTQADALVEIAKYVKQIALARDDHQALVAIQALLDGTEWTPQTNDLIADVLRAHGYQVRDVEEEKS